MRRNPDQSLFAWGKSGTAAPDAKQPLVNWYPDAESLQCQKKKPPTIGPFESQLKDFVTCRRIRAVSHNTVLRRLMLSSLPAPEYTFTPHGIRTTIPVIPLSCCLPTAKLTFPQRSPPSQWYLAILGCDHERRPGALLGRVCYIPPSEFGIEYMYYAYIHIHPKPKVGYSEPDLLPLSQATIEQCREDIQLKTIYISSPERAAEESHSPLQQPDEPVALSVHKKTRKALSRRGYKFEFQGPDEHHWRTHRLILSNHDHTLTVRCVHTLQCNHWQRLTVEAHIDLSLQLLDSTGDHIADSESEIVLLWDGTPWWTSVRPEKVVLRLATKTITLTLSLRWSARLFYLLSVEVVIEDILATLPESPREIAGKEEHPTSAAVGSGPDVHDAGEAAEAGHGGAVNGRDNWNPCCSDVGDCLHHSIGGGSRRTHVEPSTYSNPDMMQSSSQVSSRTGHLPPALSFPD